MVCGEGWGVEGIYLASVSMFLLRVRMTLKGICILSYNFLNLL